MTDWRDYDTIYTERFMGLPQDNPEGYDVSSVVKAARQLAWQALDHPRRDRRQRLGTQHHAAGGGLQAANKDFELMIYPGSRHGVFSPHYSRLQLDFIRRTLGGPQNRPVPNHRRWPELEAASGRLRVDGTAEGQGLTPKRAVS